MFAHALGGAVVHHQAQGEILNEQLNCVEEAVIHRLHTETRHTQTDQKEM